MAFVLAFTIGGEYAAGDSREVELLTEGTQLELTHELCPTILAVSKGPTWLFEIGVYLFQEETRILVAL